MVVGIFFILCSSFVTTIGGYDEERDEIETNIENSNKEQDNVVISCNIYGIPGKFSNQIELTKSEADTLFGKINKYVKGLSLDSTSKETEQLQREIISLSKEYGLLHEETNFEDFQPHFIKSLNKKLPNKISTLVNGSRGSTFFCNFATAGTGMQFPVIIFPRLIPILMTPIPRAFLHWNANEGFTSCGGLATGKGFMASGMQRGTALGFWGIGFSVFLPPFMQYGFIGYALYATCTAEEMKPWPPNYAPEISAVYPPDDAENIPILTSELSFQIIDNNGDPMDYTVTTNPDIGSGSGTGKPSGIYTVSISGLEGTEEYTWTVHATDGLKTTIKSYSFSTEATAPIVSEPYPEDGMKFVAYDISELSFHLKDPQDDPMDYTVETVPDVGSGSGSGVGEGIYNLEISSLENLTNYKWYVNVTDGENWKHKLFTFQTEPTMTFDPFEEGWQYRKKITIDHSQVDGDLENFPVLVSTIDTDLKEKAQNDGDDILFMDGPDVAGRLFHEIEQFDSASGELVAWINIPEIKSNEDTSFYIYYGNPSCISQQFPNQVWNSNYCGVWHMGENPVDLLIDSTINNNIGISNGNMNYENLVNGKIGKCIQFDGDNDYISISDSPSLKPKNVSIQAFFKPLENGPDSGFFLVKASYDIWGNADGRNYGFNWSNDKNYIGGRFERDARPQSERLGSHSTNLGSWYHLVLTFDKSTSSGAFYVNGVKIDSGENYHDSVLWYYKPWDFLMGGSRGHEGSSKEINHWFNCCLDEVRVASVSLDSEWIATEYNNQNNPSSFLSFGPEETS
jgi:hypothetical protein